MQRFDLTLSVHRRRLHLCISAPRLSNELCFNDVLSSTPVGLFASQGQHSMQAS